MNHLWNNHVFQALISGNRHLSLGTEKVKFFDENVSPFADFEDGYQNGFADLYELLPVGRKIVYATPLKISQPKGWELLQAVEGLQFIYDKDSTPKPSSHNLVLLREEHVEQMMDLAKLTKPGPFAPRTIDFGNYYGIFENEKLVAMTGQRLQVHQFSEISGVCTHPDALGKGYGSALVRHQLHLIQEQNQTPFLHVRGDNERAVELYKHLGFTVSGVMNFYFMKRQA